MSLGKRRWEKVSAEDQREHNRAASRASWDSLTPEEWEARVAKMAAGRAARRANSVSKRFSTTV